MVTPALRVSDVPIEALISDPYPVFDRIRDMGSAVWVESANIHLVTRYQDIHTVERNAEIFASTNLMSLMNAVMGHSLMRKDFDEHKRERRAVEPVFRPRNVQVHMAPYFRTLVDDLIDRFQDDGRTDLFGSFAEPLASRALVWMLGLGDVAWRDIAWWSQALMDGVGNFHGDPVIAALAEKAGTAINQAIDDVIDHHASAANGSIISAMVTAEDPHTLEQVRANVKVIIGGGLNEPRDSVLTLLLGLLSNPDQLVTYQQDPKLCKAAFEEAIRWVAPIGMYPRRVTQNTVLGDTALNEGDQLGICVGAADRDPRQFDNPHGFDIHRSGNRHLGFGAGPHFCAGAWVARQMVGEIAVPRLLERLSNLQLDPDKRVVQKGWVFRGPISLPVLWD